MFENLKEHRVILVTGCQRSGTRIAARMIAEDTGHRYVDETEFGTVSIHNFLRMVKATDDPIVVHGPALAVFINSHITKEGIFVVWMKRNHIAIQDSMKRIDWDGFGHELASYLGIVATLEHKWMRLFVPQMKDSYWDNVQRPSMDGGQYLELEYGELWKHTLWKRRSDRKWNEVD